jgi:hypothetical protein
MVYTLHKLSEGNTLKENQMVRNCRNALRILHRSPEGRPRNSLDDNIKMDLRQIMFEGVDWIHLACDRNQGWPVLNPTINIQVP